jgi:glycosyltransferase involved in cell wall biosynthesis
MSTAHQPTRWICCQLGAREHYAAPRAVARHGRLQMMVTDAWVRPGALLRRLPGALASRLAERFHPELGKADVRDFTGQLLQRELTWRLRRRPGWDQLMERNEWFQQRVVAELESFAQAPNEQIVLFAHSYSARLPFRVAKARGWKTVLGQIDPGPEHFTIVRRLSDQSPQYGVAPVGPPLNYFEHWHQECALADRIVVNSDWAREAAIKAGVEPGKLGVVPIAYEPEPQAEQLTPHVYPDRFTRERPLRVLFVGSVSVAKGAASLLESLSQLKDIPVTLRLVGEVAMTVPSAFLAHPAVEWVGAVSRSEVMRHYRDSDVLVFPSHSDGFGMAQVEAQARGLPVVASRHCGHVVDDGVTGIVMPRVTAHEIATAIRHLAERPDLLHRFSLNALGAPRFGVEAMGAALLNLAPG